MDERMYREQIIDLYENPLNFGRLEPADISYEEDNPLCGDVIQIDVRLDDENRITDVKWHGQGCAISQASASLLTEEIKGKTPDDAIKYLTNLTNVNSASIRLTPFWLKTVPELDNHIKIILNK